MALRIRRDSVKSRMGLSIALGAFVAGALFLAACGSGSATIDTPTAGAPTTVAATTPPVSPLVAKLQPMLLAASDISPKAVGRPPQEIGEADMIQFLGADPSMPERLQQWGFKGAVSEEYAEQDIGDVLVYVIVTIQEYANVSGAEGALQYFHSQVPGYEQQARAAAADASLTSVKVTEFSTGSTGESGYGFLMVMIVKDSVAQKERILNRSTTLVREKNYIVTVTSMPARETGDHLRLVQAVLAKIRAAG